MKSTGLTRIAAVAALSLVATQGQALVISWADWTEVGAGGTVSGEISTGGGTIGVSYSNSASSIAGAQVSGGTDYWTNGLFSSSRDASDSAYTSVGPDGVDNIPTGTDIIRMSAVATHTLEFDSPVENIYLSYVSINGNTLIFDTMIELLSNGAMDIDGNGIDDCGYWGCGTASVVSGGGEHRLVSSGEAHGTLLLRGTFTELSFSTTITENWHGFTIGIVGPGGPIDPPRIPLPGTMLLFLGGLGALGTARWAQTTA